MPPTLLLADDSVTIQRVIELTFADEDVRVLAVSSGDEAIEVLNRTPPDIVLADVGMPGPSGYDIARHIKDTPHLAHIPVVLLTGAFEPVNQARAAAVACAGVLAKPFEPQLVIGRVKELLARPKQAASPSPAPQSPPPEPAAVLWTPPTADPGFPGDFAKAPPPAGVDDYFDRLDHALAHLSDPETIKTVPPPVSAESDWFGLKGGTAEMPPAADTWDRSSPQNLPDLPLSHGSSTIGFDPVGGLGGTSFAPPTPPLSQPFGGAPALEVAPPPAWPPPLSLPPLPVPPPVTVSPPVAVPSPPLLPLADAFAALLEAERSASGPSTVVWPAVPAPAPVLPDLVEQVTRSVLERLSDRVVRETVRDIVTGVAERLVREEIERIKSDIK